MILGFKQYFPWHTDKNPAPTNFREKIIERFYEDQPNPIIWTPKIHTFREDPHNRWKAGMKVSMVYRGAGYKILDWFNEKIPELGTIKSIQKIKIEWVPFTVAGKSFDAIDLTIDGGKSLRNDQIMILAANDGFNSIEDFKRWFKKDWEGKILHFTDFRYE